MPWGRTPLASIPSVPAVELQRLSAAYGSRRARLEAELNGPLQPGHRRALCMQLDLLNQVIADLDRLSDVRRAKNG